MPDGTVIDRGFDDLADAPRLRPASDLIGDHAAFDRLLALLRITNSQVSLFHLRIVGDAGASETDRLIGRFEREALVERLDATSGALLFVRRGEGSGALTARVIDDLRQGLSDDGLSGSARVEITAIHRDSGAIGDADELMTELLFQVSVGARVVAV